MREPGSLWADPVLVYSVAAVAVALLLATVWLFRRPKRGGRQAATVCLLLSIGLHVVLFVLVPMAIRPGKSSGRPHPSSTESGFDTVRIHTFDPDMTIAEEASPRPAPTVDPLPVAGLSDLLSEPGIAADDSPAETSPANSDHADPTAVVPASLASSEATHVDAAWDALDAAFREMLEQTPSRDELGPVAAVASPDSADAESATEPRSSNTAEATQPAVFASGQAKPATVAGDLLGDFANRVGAAKELALLQTGGDPRTEAAVAAALQFLTRSQRPDGAWDPVSSGAGQERAPLGETREGAGKQIETALTGLALLSLMGAGHTHQEGEHAESVYRGLVYLIRAQKPDGSLAGDTTLYSANYSHGMAALAMAEAAAMTGDPAAMEATRRAVAHTQRMQHPTTGGFRYRQGDAGDLSQLGWQAMVLDAGYRAGVRVDPAAVWGVQRFLRTVRGGAHGGLARYRPGEAPSRTMTAEALATRLLLGESIPAAEIMEAERSLLEQPPGVGQDNYYYWYYATLALHQLQDDAWHRWNQSLQTRLLETQRPDGSWPNTTVWGGYGGTIYTTAMATLCLETYYRHAIRGQDDRIANRPE